MGGRNDEKLGLFEEVHLFVSGRVQGVGFRYHTREQATALGLTGWVRNTEDGRVEVVAVGPADALDRLIAWSRRGPAASEVHSVDIRYRKSVQLATTGFEIRR